MILHKNCIKGLAALLVAAGLALTGGGVWAAHDCCGHPPESRQTADSDTGASSPDNDCPCVCCQADAVASPLSGHSWQIDPRSSVVFNAEFAVSRAETEIFHPPLS